MARTHGNKHIKKFIREIEKIGFTVIQANNRYKMIPPRHFDNQKPYFTHGTPKSIQPMCSDFRKMYGLQLRATDFL